MAFLLRQMESRDITLRSVSSHTYSFALIVRQEVQTMKRGLVSLGLEYDVPYLGDSALHGLDPMHRFLHDVKGQPFSCYHPLCTAHTEPHSG